MAKSVAGRGLLTDLYYIKDGFLRQDFLQGQELEVAVLFTDIRSFTQLSEKKPPYDAVYREQATFLTDGYASFQSVIHTEQHRVVTKR